jgi:hypothetical protein
LRFWKTEIFLPEGLDMSGKSVPRRPREPQLVARRGVGFEGAGGEVGVMSNLTVPAEFRYIDYGTLGVAFPLSSRALFIGSRSEEILLGANYKFN